MWLFLKKKPLECEVSVYSNSENAIGRANWKTPQTAKRQRPSASSPSYTASIGTAPALPPSQPPFQIRMGIST